MSYGLEIWNAAGVKTLKTTDRLNRFVGQYDVYAPDNNPVSVSCPGMRNDGTWTVFSTGYFVEVLMYTDYFVLIDQYSPETTRCLVLRT